MNARGFARAGPAALVLILAFVALVIAPISTAGAASQSPAHPSLVHDTGQTVLDVSDPVTNKFVVTASPKIELGFNDTMQTLMGSGGSIEASTSTAPASHVRHYAIPSFYWSDFDSWRHATNGTSLNTMASSTTIVMYRITPARMLGTASGRRLDLT